MTGPGTELPTFVTPSDAPTGLAVVNFPNSATKYLDSGGPTVSDLGSNGGITVAVVIRDDDDPASLFCGITSTTDTGGLNLQIDPGGFPTVGAAFVSYIAKGLTSMTYGAYHLLSFTIYGSGASPTGCDIYLDGVLMSVTFTSGVTLTSGRTMLIGGSPSFSNATVGRIGEIIKWNAPLSSTDQGNLHTYIVNKWGTP